jgi:hypothetical protein
VWLINKQNITTFNYHYKLKQCIHTIHFNRSLFQKCCTLHFQPAGYGLFHLWPIYAWHMTKHHHNIQTSFQYHLINLYDVCINKNVGYSDSWTLRMGPIGCSKTLVRNYH